MFSQDENEVLAAAAKVAEVETPAAGKRGGGIGSLIGLGSNILLLLGKVSEIRNALNEAGVRDQLQALIADAIILRDTMQQVVDEVRPPPES